ncbi:MAG: hypothetical protein QM532_01145 [Cyanobium sp. MAG06]|nr:hypothetical protein [Cyanobium sp. MAG06]
MKNSDKIINKNNIRKNREDIHISTLITAIKSLNIEYSNTSTILDKYSKDASIFTIRPKVVFFPKNTAEIEIIYNFVLEWNNNNITENKNKLSISN